MTRQDNFTSKVASRFIAKKVSVTLLGAGGGENWPVPVGQSHHNVEWGQEEHKVEEGVAVLDHVLLVVLHSLGAIRLLWQVAAAATLGQDDRVFGGHCQLVHLAGAGGSNAEDKQIKIFSVCPSVNTKNYGLIIIFLMIAIPAKPKQIVNQLAKCISIIESNVCFCCHSKKRN